ncbi:unnamed protein product [Prorocentrum cordatum]|uniref:DNA polymerase delta subunit OB-fold domain-containing protein n=1 Tax=Prorocentrum cordatum TaxID=2364126 RepID=A0ABN9S8Z1_9DINO|nr:unnamed protein product [Polarella glacialis]
MCTQDRLELLARTFAVIALKAAEGGLRFQDGSAPDPGALADVPALERPPPPPGPRAAHPGAARASIPVAYALYAAVMFLAFVILSLIPLSQLGPTMDGMAKQSSGPPAAESGPGGRAAQRSDMAPAAKKAAAKAKADASQTSKQGFSSLFGRKPGAADGAPAAPPPEAAAAAPAMAAQPAPPCAPVPPSGAGPAAAAAAGAAAAAAGVPAPAATAGVSQLTEEQKSRIEENRRRAEERRAAKKRALEPGAPEAPPPQQSPPPQAPSPEAKAKAKAKAKTKAKAKAKAKAEGSEPVGADAAASPPKSDASPHLAVETPEKTPPGGKAVRPAAPPAHAAAGGGGKFAAIGGAWGQFNDVYRWRLQHLRGPVLQEARKLWGGMLPPQSFAPDIGGYKRGVEGQEAVIVGVAFKDLKSRTDVIKMYQDAIGFGHISDKETLHLGQSICSDEDSVWLEDSAMRVQLALPPEEAGRIATGVVLAARGAATPEGLFRPTALCCASVPAPPPLPAMAADPAPGPFLALVSGLGFGDKEAESTGLAAARERLRGLFASEDGQAPPGAVQKLIVCGGLVRADFREKGSVVAAMAEADAAFAKIAAIVPTEVARGGLHVSPWSRGRRGHAWLRGPLEPQLAPDAAAPAPLQAVAAAGERGLPVREQPARMRVGPASGAASVIVFAEARCSRLGDSGGMWISWVAERLPPAPESRIIICRWRQHQGY